MPLSADVRKEVARKLEENEGRVDHLYLDSVGRVTVGVGHLIASRIAASSLVLYQNGSPPTCLGDLREKTAEYDEIIKQPVGYKASWYKRHTTLVMKADDIDALRDGHIDNFYSELTNIYRRAKGYQTDFDNLPTNVQMALFDMIFNIGATKIVGTFTVFDQAIRACDWKTAAQHSYRPQVSTERNEYVKQLFPSVPQKTP
jgi:GH24 family phage-related lysozyme (muramidase)